MAGSIQVRHFRELMAAFFVTWLLLAPFALASPAAAVTSSDFYRTTFPPGKWPNQHIEPFFVRSGFPTISYTDRINNSKDTWNAAAGAAEPDFSYSGATTATGNADNPCAVSWSAIYWRNLDYIDPGVLGFTPACKNSSGQTLNFSMSIDSDTNWYTGTGSVPFSTQWDLQSIVTHEWGHATAFWGHISESDAACPTTTARATMCIGNAAMVATIRLRTLESIDISLFQGAY